MIPPLINAYLLGKHVELRLKNGDIERGVVVNLQFSSERRLVLTREERSDYRKDLACWVPQRPREEWTRQHDQIESIMVIDFDETKSVPEIAP